MDFHNRDPCDLQHHGNSTTSTSNISTGSTQSPPLSNHEGRSSSPPEIHLEIPLPICPRKNQHPMTTRSKAGIYKPKGLATTLVPVTKNVEPISPSSALLCPEWKKAMNDEIQALQLNNTWSLVPPHASQKLVGHKWVFKIKRNPDGSVQRHKARLVAKGFHQTPGIDFHETFSPVIKPSMARVVLSIPVSKGWDVHQIDINNAFLNGILSEEVYMSQPIGFVDDQRPYFVCRLHRSLYGLRQAPRAWYERLGQTLCAWGFHKSVMDSSLFMFRNGHSVVWVLVYVDDILITGNNKFLIDSFISRLSSTFALKDLGSLSYFLGIEVFRTKSGMHLSQAGYINDLLKRTNMQHCKSSPSPASSSIQLGSDIGSSFSDTYLYRSTIGALQYVTITRPELSFIVNKLSQFMHKPTDTH